MDDEMITEAEYTEQLVGRARGRDSTAWHELVASYTPRLLRVARAFGLNDADAADVVQTTWLRCVQYLGQIRDLSSIGSWLTTICRREAMRILQRENAPVPYDPSDPFGPLARLADEHRDPGVLDMLRHELQAELVGAITELPDRQRALLMELLRADYDGRAYADVGTALEMPVGSIGPTRMRALQRLRRNRRLAELKEDLECCR
jgi:RNA polymerase sigma factor (sigma-70 family)